MIELVPGQRVKVTYEGVVQENTFLRDGEIEVCDGSQPHGYHYHMVEQVQIEPVEHYIVGAIYQDANGIFWEYTEKHRGYDRAWLMFGIAMLNDYDAPERPLVRMVPESEPDPDLEETLDALRRKLSGESDPWMLTPDA